jgi:hypothetical protein
VRAEESTPERDRDPDGAGADDQHHIARLKPRFVDRVQSHGERLNQRALGETHGFG